MKMKFAKSVPTQVKWGIAASPAGKLAVGVAATGEICRIGFMNGRKAQEIIAEWQTEWPKTQFSAAADVKNFPARPVLLIGTPFQQTVWRAMAKIPAGKVATYGALARRIGKPRAARAVGAACGANPVPYLIPCHRVVAANGGLGGFSGGVEVKEKLLKVEGYL